MSNQPVYRRPPRSHAYSCRCPRCAQFAPSMRNGDYGLIGPLLLLGGIFTVIGFWPAMVWHGYTDTGGWRWDIHSTAAEAVYFGVIAFLVLLVWLGNRVPAGPRPVPPKGRLRVEVLPDAPVPPICFHPNAVRIDSVLDPGVVYRCWCPDCDPECLRPLPAAFRLACCGAEPGTGIKPARHMYNCPQGGPR